MSKLCLEQTPQLNVCTFGFLKTHKQLLVGMPMPNSVKGCSFYGLGEGNGSAESD